MCEEYIELLPLIGSGELSDQDEIRLTEHLKSCVACRREATLFSRLPAIIGKPSQTAWSADVVASVLAAITSRANSAGAMPTQGEISGARKHQNTPFPTPQHDTPYQTSIARTDSRAVSVRTSANPGSSHAPTRKAPGIRLGIAAGILLALSFVGLWVLQAGHQASDEGASPTPLASPTVTVTPDGTVIGMSTREAFSDASLATAVARATSSPYPEAEPVRIQTGQPSIATARQGDLTFEMRLPKNSYLAGEAGQALVTVSNDGPEIIFGKGFSIGLVDKSGLVPAWPLMPQRRDENVVFGSRENYKLGPGESISRTLTFQVPPLNAQSPGSQVQPPDSNPISMWAATEFSLAGPESDNKVPDLVTLNLEAGPLPLEIQEPTAEQRLQVHLSTDATGYRLSVTDSQGKIPTAKIWGEMQTIWRLGSMGKNFSDDDKSAPGTWFGTWFNLDIGNDGKFTNWVWVAAEGYVTAVITETTSTGRSGTPVNSVPAPSDNPIGYNRLAFETLDEAQAYLAPLGVTMSAPSRLPTGSTLENVRVDQVNAEFQAWSEVSQLYTLKIGDRNTGPTGTSTEVPLKFVQVNNIGAFMGAFGPQDPGFRAAAQHATAGPHEIYIIQRFGLWLLVWNTADTGFQLSAPVSDVSLETLLEIAASVTP